MFVAALQAGALKAPTYDLKTTSRQENVIDVEDQSEAKRFVFSLSYKLQFLHYEGMSERRKTLTETFARSFGRGIKQNILDYTDAVISRTKASILEAERLRKSLRTALLPNSALSVSVALHNTGRSPMTFMPHFGLRIEHEKYRDHLIVLATQGSKEAQQTRAELAIGNGTLSIRASGESGGERFFVEPFLPDTMGVRYVTVGPGESNTIVLRAEDALGELAAGLLSLHQTELLTASVVGLTTQGDLVRSEPVAFGRSMAEAAKSKLHD